MTKRTISVFRFKGFELQSNFPIGSPEFDEAFNNLCHGYMNIPNSDMVVQAEVPFGKPSFNIQDLLSSKPGVHGLCPITILWIEKKDPNEAFENGELVIYPKVFHKAEGFIGRIEVEEEPIELVVV